MASLFKLKKEVENLNKRKDLAIKKNNILLAMNLTAKVNALKKIIEEEEESLKPKPIRDIMPDDKLRESGIIELMIECHLAADYLNAVTCEIIDTVGKFGYKASNIVPQSVEIAKKTQEFTSYMCNLGNDNLSEIMIDNETLINALYKKTASYIKQRFEKPKKR